MDIVRPILECLENTYDGKFGFGTLNNIEIDVRVGQ